MKREPEQSTFELQEQLKEETNGETKDKIADKYFNLPPKMEKFDENYLSIDERLKYAVKRCYFSNKNEVDYDKINYQIL